MLKLNATSNDSHELFLLEDWQNDKWQKIYHRILKGSKFVYTTVKQEAEKNVYPKDLGEVYSTSIKKMDTRKNEKPEYLLRLVNERKQELGQVKATELGAIEAVARQVTDARNELENLGYPLTIRPHESSATSYLDSENPQEVSLRGLLNLMTLLLITYNIRFVVQSLQERDLVLIQVIRDFWSSGITQNIENYYTFFATLLLLIFPVISYAIEKMAATRSCPEAIITLIIVVHLLAQLTYPIVMIQVLQSPCLHALYFMMFTVGQALKLWSFHHVMSDNRALADRVQAELGPKVKVNMQKMSKTNLELLSANLHIEQDTLEMACSYPNNLRIGHYIRYLCAPTCCYQEHYPTTPRIRVRFIMKRLFEFALGNFLMTYLVYQHMIPIAEDALPHMKAGNKWEILEATLHMAVPAAYIWLVQFYLLFHSYLNFWAELTQFGDRRFYSDWWNAGSLGEYWRKWNHPIHNFLIRHIYFPMRRRKLGSMFCLFSTFFVSAVFHEYIVVGIFSVCNFVAFTLMMVNVPCMAIQRQFKNQISANTNNVLFWLSYIILGQPFGILLVYYQMSSDMNQVSLKIDPQKLNDFTRQFN